MVTNNNKDIIRKFGEVKTQNNEIKNMIGLVNEEINRVDSRFLEPACGDGNFLIEVLNRKLSVVKEIYHKNQHDFEKYSFIAIANIYGVDIRNENVLNCRKRLSVCFEKSNKNHVKSSNLNFLTLQRPGK